MDDHPPNGAPTGPPDAPGPASGHHYDDQADPRPAARARLLLAGALLALFGAVLGYRVLHAGHLEQTALFYVGLPAALALLVVATARPRSAVGTAMAVTTVGLLLAGPLLDEGIVCLLLAAPLFYGVAAAVGAVADIDRRSHSRRNALVLAPLLLALCAEGVGGLTYLPRAGEGRAETVVAAPPAAVARALAAPFHYADPESVLLRTIPFPRPLSATGTGLEPGDGRTIAFPDRRSLGFGSRPTPRGMAVEVVESRVGADSGRVLFAVTEDTTLARWLDLRTAEVAWEPAGAGTRVTWTLDYRRTFDPSWYWGPIQRYAVGEAAGYLADTTAAAATGAGGETGTSGSSGSSGADGTP
nr:hypothetical protein [Nocardiopsis trehalosi]